MKFKHLLSLVLICVFAFSASAQVTDRGNFLIGGTLGFSAATSDFEVDGTTGKIDGNAGTSSQFNIAPAIGYFFTDNFALGIGLDYTLNTSKVPEDPTDPNSDVNKTIDSDLLFGPFARYYLPITDDKAFFVESTFGIGSSANEIVIDGNAQTTSTNVMAIGIGPGFTIFSSDAIGIEALAKYNWARSNTDIEFQEVNTESTSYTNAIDFSVGLQFYFSRVNAAGN
ncbi:MAG: outer membrane beta-barrel protein [Bacteroidota bacterium]